MGKKSTGLGRGMGEIIRDHSVDISKFGVEAENYAGMVSLDIIDPNPFQPRKKFDQEVLLELSESIKQHGLLQPVLLRKKEGRFQIISGERRVRASRLAGLQQIEARVFDLLSDKTMAEWALIENIQREDLDPIEIAFSYQQLLNLHGYTHDDLADSLGKSRASITNSLRLLRLPSVVQQWIQEGKLSAGTARSLLSPNVADPEKLARKIIEQGLSTRDAESLVGTQNSDPAVKNAKTPAHANQDVALNSDMRHFLDFLQSALGVQITCKPSKINSKSGSLIINYSSTDDLTRIQNIVRTGTL